MNSNSNFRVVLVTVALITGLPSFSTTQSAHAQILGLLDLSGFGVGNCSALQNCTSNNNLIRP